MLRGLALVMIVLGCTAPAAPSGTTTSHPPAPSSLISPHAPAPATVSLQSCDEGSLETALPSTILGEDMWRTSGRGIEGDRSGRVEVAFIELLGATDDDYTWAMAGPRDDSLKVLIQAFRVCGAPEERLLDAYTAAFKESIELNLGMAGGSVTQRSAIVGDKEILAFTGENEVMFLHADGDTVVAVWASDEDLSAQVIGDLPTL